jgi:ribosome-binding protein aMBF1 (putative translation factor)
VTLLDRVLLARADEQTAGSRLPPDGRDPWAIGKAHAPRRKPTLRRLTDDQVRRIRKAKADGMPTKHLADRYGVAKGVIQAICEGRTYREVA